MTNEIKYPYSDDLMLYDDRTGRYYLTETAMIEAGVDLRTRLSYGRTPSPDAIINGLIKRTTILVYNYIHKYSANNARQDRLLATVPALRDILYNALTSQVLYILSVGDLTLSTDPNVRDKAMDETAKDMLSTCLPELGGRSILYAGV